MNKTKFIASSLAIAVAMGTMPSVFASSPTSMSVVRTQIQNNVVAGLDNTQSVSVNTIREAVSPSVDNTQSISGATITANAVAGLDTTQAINHVSNGATSGTNQVNKLSVTGTIDSSDNLQFSNLMIGTIQSSVSSVNVADHLGSIVSQIQAHPLYPVLGYTAVYDFPTNSIVLTASFPNNEQNVYSFSIVDGGDTTTAVAINTPTTAGQSARGQLDTLTIAGVIEGGDKFIFNFDGNPLTNVSYVATPTDTPETVATELMSRITAVPTYDVSPFIVTNEGSGVLKFSAKSQGTPFTISASAENAQPTAEVFELTVGGTVETGDKFTVNLSESVSGTPVAATHTAGTGGVNEVTASLVSQLQSIVAANTGIKVSVSSPASNKILLTSTVAGTPIYVGTNTENVGGTKQLKSVSVSGTVEVGDTFTLTLPSSTVITHKSGTGETTSDVAGNLVSKITSGTGYAGETIVASLSGSSVLLEAKVEGAPMLISSSAVNRPSMAQSEEFTFSGTTTGKTVTLTIDGVLYSETTETSLPSDIVSALKTAINANTSSAVVATGTSSLILTAKTAGSAFSSEASVVDSGVVNKKIKLKSGWNVFSTPKKLSGLTFSNSSGAGLSFYKMEGGTWAGTTVAPTIENVQPLDGFVVYNANPGTVEVYLTYATGLSLAERVHQKTVGAGWNILGITTTSNPFSTIGAKATSSVDFTNGTGVNGIEDEFSITTGDATIGSADLGEAYGVFMTESGIYGGSQ